MARKKTRFTWEEQANLVEQAACKLIKGKCRTEIVSDRAGHLNNISTFILNPELNTNLITSFSNYNYDGSKYKFEFGKVEENLEGLPEISNKRSWLFYSPTFEVSEVLSWNIQEPVFKVISALEKENIHDYIEGIVSDKGKMIVLRAEEQLDNNTKHWVSEGKFRCNWLGLASEYVVCRYRNTYLETKLKLLYNADVAVVKDVMEDIDPDPSMEVLKPLKEIYY